MSETFKVGDRVTDVWWPWRVGKVLRITKTRTRVKWSDGEEWSYDSDHLKFLRVSS